MQLEDLSKTRYKVLAILILMIACYAGGRFSAPSKVVTKTITKTEIQYKDKIQVVHDVQVVEKRVLVRVADKDIHTHEEVTVTKEKNGTIITKKVIDNNTDTKTKLTNNSSTNSDSVVKKVEQKDLNKSIDQESTKIVQRDLPDWRVGALVGVNVLDLKNKPFPISYGLEVDRRIFWTVNAGAFFLSNGTVGLTLNLGF
ncbi:MAG: hypothetical protein KGO96_07640 [Elusimicrobia bacterium]|nr:hypothetical protein [Elusimicrobiota bacterium]